MRDTTLMLCFVAMAFLGLPPSDRAVADDKKSEFKAVKLKEKGLKGLVDCRSLSVRHETHVPLSTDWKAVEHTFQFTLRSNGKFVVTVTPDAEGAEAAQRVLGDKPGLITVGAFGVDYALAWRPDATAAGVWVSSGYGVAIKTKGGTAYVVDSNLDGKLGEIAKDGYLAPQSRCVAPWSSEIWSATDSQVARKVDTGWEIAPLPCPYPDNKDHAAAWRLLNWRRQQCGFLSLRYVPQLEPPMKLHCAYCALNRYRGHEQDPEKEGYHVEGAKAGAQVVLSYSQKSLLGAMQEQLATVYHRNQLLSPALSGSAIALLHGVFAANVKAQVAGPFRRAVLTYPPHGMQDVPISFSKKGETPMPTKDQPTLHTLGTAVSVSCVALDGLEALPQKPKLVVTEMQRGKPGRSYRRNLKYPGRPPHQGVPVDNFGNIAMVPSEPLAKKTTYRCVVEFPLPKAAHVSISHPEGIVEYAWEFTTGK